MRSLHKGTQLGLTALAGLFLVTTVAESRDWTQSKWELNIEEEKLINPDCASNLNPKACKRVNAEQEIFNGQVAEQQALKTWAEDEIFRIG
ncbi:MAG: hypothetical protein ACU0CA_07000 [Paracoccaceae bacterium]